MAVEVRRGWKIGGTYLETDPGWFACGRLPIPLSPCPLCDQRPRFARGLQRVTPKNLLHSAPLCTRAGTGILAKQFLAPACSACPYGSIESAEVAGLMWVGARFCSPSAFAAEAEALGVSKRVPWPLPKWMEVGKTWVFLAHEEGRVEACEACQGKGLRPATPPAVLPDPCEACDGKGRVASPAIFYAFKPHRVVRIVPDDLDHEAARDLEKEGLTLVEVPAADADHAAPRRGEARYDD